MTDKKPSNPPLFHQDQAGGVVWTAIGLRDLLAAFALAGFLADGSDRPHERDAELSYEAADAMLAEREKLDAEA